MGVGREAACNQRGSCCEAEQFSRASLPGRGAARGEKLPRTHAEIRSHARDRCMVFASRGEYSRARGENRSRETALARNREKGAARDSHAAPYPNYLYPQRQSTDHRSTATRLSPARLHKKEKARRRYVSPISPHASRGPESFAAAIPGRGHRSEGDRSWQRWHSLRCDVAAGQ